VEYDVADGPAYFDQDDEWLISGRLVDSHGNPLHSIGTAGRHTFGGDMEIGFASGTAPSTEPGVWVEAHYQRIWTDEQGYFLDPFYLDYGGTESKPTPSERRRLFDPRLQSWLLGFTADEGIQPAGRVELPPPKVDFALAMIDFGEVVVPGPVLELQLCLPEDLKSDEKIDEFGEIFVASGDLHIHIWYAEVGRTYRFAFPAGKYRVSAEFKGSWHAPHERVIDSNSWTTAPTPAPALSIVSREVVLQERDVKQLKIYYDPAPLVEVSVEMPPDASEGVLEVRYSNGESPRRPIDGEAYQVRLIPTKAVARALVPGYEPVEAELSPDVRTVILRPSKKDTASKVIVQFPDKHPPWVYLRFHGESVHFTTARIREGAAEPVTLPPGRYTLHVLTHPGSVPPDGLIADPVEFELQPEETKQLTIEGLRALSERRGDVMCGTTWVDGNVPGEHVQSPGRIELLETDGDLLCIVDAGAKYRWKPEVKDEDGLHQLHLPPRIEVRISKELREMWRGELPSYKFIVVGFDTPYGRGHLEARGYHSERALVRHFWAPPGQAEVVVRAIGDNPSLYLKRTVEVVEGKVAVVEIGPELGVARFSPADALGSKQTAAGVRPIWELRKDGQLVDWVYDSSQLLPVGSYLAKPAYGPESDKEVRFEIMPGRETAVALPQLAMVSTRGRVLLNAPDGMAGWVHFEIAVSPSPWPGYLQDWYGEKKTACARVMPDGVMVEGLPNGFPLTVTIVVNSGGKSPATCEFAATLADADLTTINVVWRDP
jgi:hypothetical protein